MKHSIAAKRQRGLSFGFGVVILTTCVLSGCAKKDDSAQSTSILRLATTTSTRDSGLLDKLLPVFESRQRCRVDVIAVGTGAALKLGEAGDVDVLLVHARQAEMRFMDAKHGTRHEEFMYNDFLLLGPANDPAEIRDVDPIESLRRIANGKHRFVSRGDQSGTHMRELQLWELNSGRPTWDDYIETGQGMGPTIVMADEMQCYVLADAGTYFKFKNRISLVALSAMHECMRNPYSVIAVNPEKHAKINESLANDFLDFLISETTQNAIDAYQLSGQQLFHSARLSEAK